ncbi:hypothetical protein F5Y16DRAFT_385855 [Xylariaceae sp. FL0255]|nr:hypothetical protein F5Y16DRAFT_385855 [Xylariaceae sp. FL0255]
MTRNRDLKNRQLTLAKKAHQYSRKFQANAAVILQDEGQMYLYTSSPDFLPDIIGSLDIPYDNIYDPESFNCANDDTDQSPSPPSSTSSSPSTKRVAFSCKNQAPSRMRTSGSYISLHNDDDTASFKSPCQKRGASPELSTPPSPQSSFASRLRSFSHPLSQDSSQSHKRSITKPTGIFKRRSSPSGFQNSHKAEHVQRLLKLHYFM